MKLVYPQEIDMYYLIPAIRRELVFGMKNAGLSQSNISKRLGLTEAAISQYLSNKRAVKIKFSSKIKKMIFDLATKINCKEDSMKVILKVLTLNEIKAIKCKIHMRELGIKECNLCDA